MDAKYNEKMRAFSRGLAVWSSTTTKNNWGEGMEGAGWGSKNIKMSISIFYSSFVYLCERHRVSDQGSPMAHTYSYEP